MNERIKELTFKAGAKLYSEPPMRQVTGVSMSFESVEKFAHLIVQECANLLVKEAKSSHDEGSETYDTLIRESNWMKRYFGVTE